MVSVRDKIAESIFRAPERRKLGLFYFAGATVFLYLHVFGESSLFLKTMFSGFLLTGAAEVVPKERNVLAGVLRLAAITVYTVFLALSFTNPEIMF